MEEMNLAEMPDDILREVGDRLQSYGRQSLRHTCRDLRRVFPQAPNKYQVRFDKLVEQRLFMKDWPGYPLNSYILKMPIKERYALFFSAQPGKIHIVPDCMTAKSPIASISERDLDIKVIQGKLYKKRSDEEVSLWTLGAWMMFSRKHEVPIEEFYPRVFQALKSLP